MPWEPHTHLCAASSPASIRGKTLKLLSPWGCWATRPLSSSMVWERSGGRRERQHPACRQGQPLGAGRVAGVPGHPSIQGREGIVALGDGEMLLGAVKERLDFSLQGHGWLWRLLLLPGAVRRRACKQEPNRAAGMHQGATFQHMRATPTVPPHLRRSGQCDGPNRDATVSGEAIAWA